MDLNAPNQMIHIMKLGSGVSVFSDKITHNLNCTTSQKKLYHILNMSGSTGTVFNRDVFTNSKLLL